MSASLDLHWKHSSHIFEYQVQMASYFHSLNFILHKDKTVSKHILNDTSTCRQNTETLVLVTSVRQVIFPERILSLCFRLNSFSLHNPCSPYPEDKRSQVQCHTSVWQQCWGAWVGWGCTESPRMGSVYAIDFVCMCESVACCWVCVI